MKNNKYILYGISFLQGLVFYGAFSVVFRENRGLGLNDIFLLEGIFVIFIMIFEIPWGIIGDKIGYKKTLVISYGLFLVSKTIFYFSYSFLGFFMEALLSSLAISGISGCDSAIIYSSIDEKESDKVFGIYGFCGTLGFLVAALTGSIIVKISIDLLAFITIFPYTLAFLLAMFLRDVKNHKSKKDGNNKKENLKDTFKIVLKDKNILLFIVAIGILNETTHSICVFLNQPLYIKNGVSLKWFGILTAFMQVATFISLKSYKIKMIIGVKNLYKISIFIIILCNLILIVSGEAYLTILIIFLIEGGYALTQPITETIKNKSIESLNRATILSIYSMIENIIASLINFIISIASKISMEWALITSLIFNILVFILIICYFYSKKKLTIVKENLI